METCGIDGAKARVYVVRIDIARYPLLQNLFVNKSVHAPKPFGRRPYSFFSSSFSSSSFFLGGFVHQMMRTSNVRATAASSANTHIFSLLILLYICQMQL